MTTLRRLGLAVVGGLLLNTLATAGPVPLEQFNTAKVQEHLKSYLATPGATKDLPAGLTLTADNLKYEDKVLTWSYAPTAVPADQVKAAATAVLTQALGQYNGGLLVSDDLKEVLKTVRVMPIGSTGGGGNKPPETSGTPPRVAGGPGPVTNSGSSKMTDPPANESTMLHSVPLPGAASCGLPVVTWSCVPVRPCFDPCAVHPRPSIQYHSSCDGCYSLVHPVQQTTYVAVVRPTLPVISAARLRELKDEPLEVVFGEINLLYSTGRLSDANLVVEQLLDTNRLDALAWCWKATLARKLGNVAAAELAAERINACLMVQGQEMASLGDGLQKIQGMDRVYLNNAPQPASLAAAKLIIDRPWKAAPTIQLTTR